MSPVRYRAEVGLNLPDGDSECRVEAGEEVPARLSAKVPKVWVERGIVVKLGKGDS